MAKTYYNQYQAMMKVNEKINCSSMSWNIYEKEGLFGPDKYRESGKRKFPLYSEDRINQIIEIIREKRTKKAARGVQINANKLDAVT